MQNKLNKSTLISAGITILIVSILGISYYQNQEPSFGAPNHTNLGNASSTNLTLLEKLYDADGDVGTSGQVLSSTGSATNWVAQTGGGSIDQLGQIGDVSTSTLAGTYGHILIYDGTNWQDVATSTIGLGGASGTVSSIATTWPITGGTITDTGTLGFGGLSTSTPAVIGNLPYFSGVNTFANVATSTLTATGLLSISNSPSIIGASGAVLTLPLTKGNFIVGNDAGVAQATSTIFISSTGLVGIGTTTPAYNLDVYGDLWADGSIYGDNINYSEGMESDPTITDAAGVNIAITSADVLIRSDATWDSGKLYRYTVPATTTIAATDNSINYVYVYYNSGSPEYGVSTNREVINVSDYIPVARIYMSYGNILYQMDYDYIARGATARNFERVMRTRGITGIERESGLTLTETATRVVNISSGYAYFGLARKTLGAIAQGGVGVDSQLWYHSSGNWATSTITAYNNTQYDNGTDLATLTANRYGVNWVFRNVEEDEIDIVLGTGDYTLAQAEASMMPALPTAISNFYVPVGRIIVQKSSDTAYAVETIADFSFRQASVSTHSDLSQLNWASAGHTFDTNLNIGAYNLLTTGTVYATSTRFVNSTTTNFGINSENFIDLTGTGLQNTNGVLTLNATGDWTGTIDGNNFAGGAIGVGDLLYGSAGGTISELARGTDGQILYLSGGLPAWVSTTSMTLAGDVGGTLGATVIGADKIKDTMIDWGTGAGQISTADITEQTNLFYLDSRVNTYLHGSSTLPKLYTENTWTKHNIFSSLFSTNASSTYATTSALYITSLGTAAGAFLAVDANGQVIATTTPTGGAATLTGTTGQIAYFSGTNTAVGTSSIFIGTDSIPIIGAGSEVMRITGGKIGIGTTTPNYLLTVYGTATTTLLYTNTLNIPPLSAASGTYLAIDGSGNAISTTTPVVLAGRSLTKTGITVDADAELYTRSLQFNISTSSLATTTSYKAFQVPVASTITQVSGFCSGGTTTIALDERATATPKAAGTDVLTAPLAIGDYASTAAFDNAGIAAGTWLNLDIDGYLIGSPKSCFVNIKLEADD